MAEARVKFYGAHAVAFQDEAIEKDIEGAVRSGKTTLCLEIVHDACWKYPGMHWMISRWSDGDTESQLMPAWREVCDRAGTRLEWNARERYDKLPSGSLVYISGLRSQDQSQRYSKLRGKTLAGGYIDQAEEIPEADIYDEFVLRLSQKGYPRMMLLSPQTVRTTHWVARYFPTDKPLRKGTSYYALKTRDNAHNLPPRYVEDMEERFPPGTPQHTTLLLGQRGAVVVGDPVYGGSKKGPGFFIRSRHERPCAYDARLPLEIGMDFGRHWPCIVARQVSPTGQTRYLGGLVGMDLHLDAFVREAQRYLARWCPEPIEQSWACDPNAVSNPIGVDLGAMLRGLGVTARWQMDSNSPIVRVALIERIMARLRSRDLAGEEAFVVNDDDERWLRIGSNGSTQWKFVADAMEFGYVWDPHDVSVGSKTVRRPKKDGEYDHGMNCCEYLEANFGIVGRTKPSVDLAEVFRQPVGAQSPLGWMGS
jgi:hypothetical protein